MCIIRVDSYQHELSVAELDNRYVEAEKEYEDTKRKQVELKAYLVDKFASDDIVFNQTSLKFESTKGIKSSRFVKIDKFIIRNYVLDFREQWTFQRDLLKGILLEKINTSIKTIEKELKEL